MSTQAGFVPEFLQFLSIAEKLKCVERDNLLSNGKFESVAGHCWMLGLMAIMLAPKMKTQIDLGKALKMIVAHDLAEAKTGDLPLYKATNAPSLKAQKQQEEEQAMQEIQKIFSNGEATEIYELWREYEDNETTEAKFVKGIDKLEAHIQALVHPDISYWGKMYDDVYYAMTLDGSRTKFFRDEPMLMEINDALTQITIEKMRAVGLDPEKYRKQS